jgi:hypothetical protein
MGCVGRPFARVLLPLALLSSGARTSSIAEAGTRGREPKESSCAPMPTPMAFVRGLGSASPDDSLRVNHLQAKATHNSYHLPPALPIGAWNYGRAPLDEQLEREGVRGVELDVHWDDDCARFRVFHIGFLDARTTCAFFTDCLVVMRAWSADHPGHHPIFVQIEPKFSSSRNDEARMVALEREILAVFDERWLLTPDELKGESRSVAEGLATHGWPTLAEARGRFVFYLNDDSGIRDAYTHRRHDLDGRLLFAEGALDEPFVAMQVSNDPIEGREAIAAALAKHLIVRTRAEDGPSMGRSGDTSLREAALASGAQIISTDFPIAVDDVPYAVTVPGGTPSRCAPGIAPFACTPIGIEDPANLGR